MSQATTWSVPTTAPATPTQFATRADEALDAVLSQHSGNSRPTYAVGNTVWVDESGGVTDYLAKYYDGASDITVYRVNTTSNEAFWRGLLHSPDGSNSAPSHSFSNDTDTGGYLSGTNQYSVATGGTERVRVSSSGLSVRSGNLDIVNGTITSLITSGTDVANFTTQDGGATGANVKIFHDSASPAANDVNGSLAFAGRSSTAVERNYTRIQSVITDPTNASEDANLLFQTIVAGTLATRGGWYGNAFLVNKTAAGLGNVGFEANANGVHFMTASAAAPLAVNRQTNDGRVISICQDGTEEGGVDVSGTTVSIGSFCGAHWSQFKHDIADILEGTVVSTIDEMCEWPGEANDQLPKCKISDVVKDKAVYGVFGFWDKDGDATIRALGATTIRIAAGVTVQGGDLLESAGDGTARPQVDDVIRSSTIGKVTANVVVRTHPDGSYLVPCVLYCG